MAPCECGTQHQDGPGCVLSRLPCGSEEFATRPALGRLVRGRRHRGRGCLRPRRNGSVVAPSRRSRTRPWQRRVRQAAARSPAGIVYPACELDVRASFSMDRQARAGGRRSRGPDVEPASLPSGSASRHTTKPMRTGLAVGHSAGDVPHRPASFLILPCVGHKCRPCPTAGTHAADPPHPFSAEPLEQAE